MLKLALPITLLSLVSFRILANFSGYVKKQGDNMTGTLTLGTDKITLQTTGEAEFKNTVKIEQGLIVDTIGSGCNDIIAAGEFTFVCEATFNENVTILKDLSVKGGISVDDDATIGGNINLTGDLNISGEIHGGGLNVGGGGLTVDGIEASGDIITGGNISVEGGATIDNGLDVSWWSHN